MKKQVHPQSTALGGTDKSRVIVSTIGGVAYMKNRSSGQLEKWRRYEGDITKAPVMFVDGVPHIRVLETQGDRMLASTMVAA